MNKFKIVNYIFCNYTVALFFKKSTVLKITVESIADMVGKSQINTFTCKIHV